MSIILPTRNEEMAIGTLLTKIRLVLPVKWIEVVVVDDGSTDETAVIVRNFSKKYSWVRLLERTEVKPNLGDSIFQGLQQARGKIIIGMDADGNHQPEDLPRLVRKFAQTLVTTTRQLHCAQNRTSSSPVLVVCSRFEHLSSSLQSWRSCVSWIFNAFLCYRYCFPVRDSTSGFYAALKTPLMSLDPEQIYTGYGEYHLRLIVRAKQANWSIAVVGIRYGKRLGGKSKSRLLQMFWKYLATAKIESMRISFPEKSQKSC